jgi:hypothetical protein
LRTDSPATPSLLDEDVTWAATDTGREFVKHPKLVERLRDAINSHDAEEVAACFSTDYRCDMPLHPSQSFRGAQQALNNYTSIFKQTPDLRAEVLRSAVDGAEIWSEWEMRGTTVTGSPTVIRGVVVFTGGVTIDWSRFYLDPVADGLDLVE